MGARITVAHVTETDALWELARQTLLNHIIGITTQVGGKELSAVLVDLAEAYARITQAGTATPDGSPT